MKFSRHKRRQAPAVIIISLIDILIVLLIFLMVTTTFKQQPSIKLALPESKQRGKAGASENNLIVTVAKQEPFFYLGPKSVTLSKLQEEVSLAVRRNPEVNVLIRSDEKSQMGEVIKAWDAVGLAGAKSIKILTKNAATP